MQRYTIQEAADALRTSHASVKRLAVELGIHDPQPGLRWPSLSQMQLERISSHMDWPEGERPQPVAARRKKLTPEELKAAGDAALKVALAFLADHPVKPRRRK